MSASQFASVSLVVIAAAVIIMQDGRWVIGSVLESYAPACEVAGEYTCDSESLSYVGGLPMDQRPIKNIIETSRDFNGTITVEMVPEEDLAFRVNGTQICAFDYAAASPTADVARCVNVENPTEYTYTFMSDCETVFVKEYLSTPAKVTPDGWVPYVTGRKVCVREGSEARGSLRRRTATPPCVDLFNENGGVDGVRSGPYSCRGVSLQDVDGVPVETPLADIGSGIEITGVKTPWVNSSFSGGGPTNDSTFILLQRLSYLPVYDARNFKEFLCGWDILGPDTDVATAQCADGAGNATGAYMRLYVSDECGTLFVETSQPLRDSEPATPRQVRNRFLFCVDDSQVEGLNPTQPGPKRRLKRRVVSYHVLISALNDTIVVVKRKRQEPPPPAFVSLQECKLLSRPAYEIDTFAPQCNVVGEYDCEGYVIHYGTITCLSLAVNPCIFPRPPSPPSAPWGRHPLKPVVRVRTNPPETTRSVRWLRRDEDTERGHLPSQDRERHRIHLCDADLG